jgi:hypothetical protein
MAIEQRNKPVQNVKLTEVGGAITTSTSKVPVKAKAAPRKRAPRPKAAAKPKQAAVAIDYEKYDPQADINLLARHSNVLPAYSQAKAHAIVQGLVKSIAKNTVADDLAELRGLFVGAQDAVAAEVGKACSNLIEAAHA